MFEIVWDANRNICVASFFFETAAKVVVTAVNSIGTAFAGYEIVAMFGFNFIPAKVTRMAFLIINTNPPL